MAKKMLRGLVLAASVVASVCLMTLALDASAQQTGKVWRVGYLGNTPTTDPDVARNWGAFREELENRGYVGGKNLVLELRFAEGDPRRYRALAAELKDLHVDIIVALTNPAARAAKDATATIPIVMVSVEDPVGTGLTNNLAHPIGNITGVTDYALDLIPKRLEFLKAAIPAASRVAFVRCLRCVAPNEAKKEAARKSDWEAAAGKLGLTLLEVDLSSPHDAGDRERLGCASKYMPLSGAGVVTSQDPQRLRRRIDFHPYTR